MRLITLAGTIAIFLLSCSQIPPYISIVAGNYSFAQGDYQSATVRYLQSLKQEQFEEWIHYNLANVYYSFGESEAAQELWEQALTSDSPTLLFAIYYNWGILLYEQGLYVDAYESFKTAVSLNPESINAKINLELSLLKSETRTSKPQSKEGRELSANSIRILEYVRRKEKQVWSEQIEDQPDIQIEDW